MKISTKINEIDDMVDAKEDEVISLYAKQVGVSIPVVEEMYANSRLRKIIRDKKTALYLESPYFILERYSEYMEPIEPVDIIASHTRHATIMRSRAFVKKK